MLHITPGHVGTSQYDLDTVTILKVWTLFKLCGIADNTGSDSLSVWQDPNPPLCLVDVRSLGLFYGFPKVVSASDIISNM